MKFRCLHYDAIGAATAVDGVIDVTPDVAAALGLGEPIEEPAAPAADDVITAFLSAPAVDVIAKIAEVPAEKADVLASVRDAEAHGKKRKTVLDAIEARLQSFLPPVE